MSSPFTSFAVASSFLLAVGCNADDAHSMSRELGFGRASSAPTETQQRPVGAFERIRSRGSMRVIARAGEPASVVVQADADALDEIVTEVREGTLHIELRSGSHDFATTPEIHVSAPRLLAVESSGSGDVRVEGLEGDLFEASGSGSGDVELLGRTDRLRVQGNGSGNIDASELSATDVELSLRGSGDAVVRASRRVAGTSAGSGDVRVIGAPPVRSVRSSGSGNVEFDSSR